MITRLAGCPLDNTHSLGARADENSQWKTRHLLWQELLLLLYRSSMSSGRYRLIAPAQCQVQKSLYALYSRESNDCPKPTLSQSGALNSAQVVTGCSNESFEWLQVCILYVEWPEWEVVKKARCLLRHHNSASSGQPKRSMGSIHPRLRTRDRKSESIPAMWPPSYSYGNRVSITVTESNELLDRDPESNRAS